MYLLPPGDAMIRASKESESKPQIGSALQESLFAGEPTD